MNNLFALIARALPRCLRSRKPLLCALLCLCFSNSLLADNIRDSNRLLRLSNVGEQFEATVRRQAGDLIRTYDNIVYLEEGQGLPRQIKQRISQCYLEAYSWDNFSDRVAVIMAETYSEAELKLLIGFYRDRGLAPMQIEAFKVAQRKSDEVERLLIEHIFEQGKNCIHENVEIILNYVDSLP